MPDNINVNVSPESQSVGQADHQHMVDFLAKLDALIREHGFDSYLVTVYADKKPRGLFTTAIGTTDSDQALLMLRDAARTVQQLERFTNPTAPGVIS